MAWSVILSSCAASNIGMDTSTVGVGPDEEHIKRRCLH